jgi:hypothetical protein
VLRFRRGEARDQAPVRARGERDLRRLPRGFGTSARIDLLFIMTELKGSGVSTKTGRFSPLYLQPELPLPPRWWFEPLDGESRTGADG